MSVYDEVVQELFPCDFPKNDDEYDQYDHVYNDSYSVQCPRCKVLTEGNDWMPTQDEEFECGVCGHKFKGSDVTEKEFWVPVRYEKKEGVTKESCKAFLLTGLLHTDR